MTRSSLTRRKFLQASAATAAAVSLLPDTPSSAQAHAAQPWPENGTLIPDEGWRLWVDREAAWKDDSLFLPEDISVNAAGEVLGAGKPLPTNPPTGGWSILRGQSAAGSIPVTLPSTVEQHFWGKFGQRPYTPDEYRYAADDPIPQNGAYFGVSWWYRPIAIPAAMRGKRIFLHIRGAHLRAEVYLNGKLVGYSIMEELPFECDLTHAANFSSAAGAAAENLLAIRITNPFGRFDWVDGGNAQWGAVSLFRSHGFGGLDRGLSISAHGDIRIKDAWALNTPLPTTIAVKVRLSCYPTAQTRFEHHLLFEIKDPATGAVLERHTHAIDLSVTPSRENADPIEFPVELMLSAPKAQLWDRHTPHLYHLVMTIPSNKGIDTRTIPIAFRSFTVDGLGTNALFRLNGRRTKIYTAISWGFWGLNGMWPTPELATKEVTQAKKLNLNCLNFHRNLAKEEVLRAHDRLGLMRYMEPGGGGSAIGRLPATVQANAPGVVMEKPVTPAEKFAQRYMFVKCVEMVKTFRSHPSVIEYCLKNEIGADLSNPDTIAILEAMHNEDPSRCVVLNDGFVAPPRKAAQAWYEPWSFDPQTNNLKPGKLHRSDQEEWGGWWNQHQGAGDQWYDEFYKSPTDFTYRSPETKALSEFGEMEGCATPDNHSLMLHQYADPRGTGLGNQPPNQSYDLVDHQEIEAAASAFLTRWGFRQAFPATERLWTSLGKRCYNTWQNYLENARISDELDFCAISGWETTAIENHSGIVDNLRNFKSDPTPIASTLLPIRPVAKQRAMCVALGQSATFDLFLLNDTSAPATGTLSFTAVTPSGKLLQLGTFPAPAQTPDVFSYLIKESFITPSLTEKGMYRFKFAISSAPANTHTKDIWVADTSQAVLRGHAFQIAVSNLTPATRRQLQALGPAYAIVDFTPGEHYDAIITSGLVTGASTTQTSGDTTGLEAQPAPGQPRAAARPGHIDPAILDAVRNGTPLLAMPQTDALSEGVAQQLAAAGAFTYSGAIGGTRAPWMGNWYFVRRHDLFDGMPVDQCMGIHYQARGQASNGLLVERAPNGTAIEIIAAYSRDHDRRIGAGTFTTRLGRGKLLYHRVPEMHPVLQQRFLANALRWLTT